MVSRADLAEQFSNFGIDLADDVLDKCWEACVEAGVDEEEFLETWMAYSVSKLGGAEPTVDLIGQMERDEFGKKSSSQNRIRSTTPVLKKKREGGSSVGLVVYDPNGSTPSSSVIENDILEAYYTTPKANKREKKQKDSFDEGYPAAIKGTPVRSKLNFSPASFSPVITAPSANYTGRGNSGQMVCSHGIPKGGEWSWTKGNTSYCPLIEIMPPSNDSKQQRWRYMDDDLRHVVDILDNNLMDMEECLSKDLGTWEAEPLDQAHKNQQNYLGRICCDGSGRLSFSSALLEGPIESSLNGKAVPLELSHLLTPVNGAIPKKSISIFPGQAMIVKGTNEKGKRVIAHEIHCKASLALPINPPTICNETGPLQIIVAAGPYTQMDTLSYQPLQDLIDYVCLHRPHVLILLGPFVDYSHPKISGEGGCPLAETFDAYFERMVCGIMQSLQGVNIQVVLVSSSRDAHALPIYPTPAYSFTTQSSLHQYLISGNSSQKPKLILAPDPCLLNIGGVVTGVTSTDILMHLGREELASSGQQMDRLSRLVQHIIWQKNFYPLYPPAIGTNVDYKMWSKFCSLPMIPHLMIVPSELRGFIKEVEGSLVVNPESLAKGMIGGTFAQFEVQPQLNWKSSLCDSIKAQVVKI